MPLEVDMTEVPLAVRKRMHEILTDENAMALMQAKIRQKKIAQFYHQNQARSIDGIGGMNMAVDPYFIGYFNMLHRRNVWHDPDFQTWLKKEEDMFRVRSAGTRLQVGYASTPIYKKVYPDNPKLETRN